MENHAAMHTSLKDAMKFITDMSTFLKKYAKLQQFFSASKMRSLLEKPFFFKTQFF